MATILCTTSVFKSGSRRTLARNKDLLSHTQPRSSGVWIIRPRANRETRNHVENHDLLNPPPCQPSSKSRATKNSSGVEWRIPEREIQKNARLANLCAKRDYRFHERKYQRSPPSDNETSPLAGRDYSAAAGTGKSIVVIAPSRE